MTTTNAVQEFMDRIVSHNPGEPEFHHLLGPYLTN